MVNVVVHTTPMPDYTRPPNPNDLKPYQATRRELYQQRILALKGARDASSTDAIGFVLDAIITAMVTGDDTELLAIAQVVAAVKAEVPKPATPARP